MQKHQQQRQRVAFVPAAATTSHDMLYGTEQQLHDDKQRNVGIKQMSAENEIFPYVSHPQPLMTMDEQQYNQSWQHTSDSINAKSTQEAFLDFNNNNYNTRNNLTTPSPPPTATATTSRLHKRAIWQNPKQYRSCNNLSSMECASASSSGAGSVYSAEFHQMDMWRRNLEKPDEARDSDLFNVRLQCGEENHSSPNNHCNIGNCGKILWISRKPQTQQNCWQQQSDVRAQSGNSASTKYASVPGIIVRTNVQGLPYTPLPHQRQAYLANQHAVEAAIPLVLNGVGVGVGRMSS